MTAARHTDDEAISAALRAAGIHAGIRATRDLSGGCIHRVVEVALEDGTRYAAKLNRRPFLSMFEEESAGLRALDATKTVLVPRVLTCTAHEDLAVLLMTFLPSHVAVEALWEQFGRELATLHRTDAGARYGFDADNHLGSTSQPNAWSDDWVEFNATQRLGHQLALAHDAGLMRYDELAQIDRVIQRLDRLIPRRPTPALLHGDLWAGNALPTVQDHAPRIAIIDPACYVGDGWADIAMMKLFGGFPKSCMNSYSAAIDDHDQLESRIAVYQLYHVLNHVNLFGRGYVPQAMSLASKLI